MSEIKFRIAAKTDVGCARSNNEDNFQAAADLSQPTMSWVNNQTYHLGDKGSLLVVADGMGGMNAGEVASAIAIDTVREFFTPDHITPEVLKSRFTIEKFMKDVVVEADRRIKSRSTTETHGMGTTIVMAWLLDGQCYVCWCGDSRAYLYNPVNGLSRMSKDHSYVQTLVDLGKITDEEAFDYPDNNVITRCLCDAHRKAEPDCLVQPHTLCNGDLILLCSDGLNGMLRDNAIEKLINEGSEDVNVLTDALIDAALAAGGNDNVTVAVARIDEGGAKATDTRVTTKDLKAPAAAASEIKVETGTTKPTDNVKPPQAKGKKIPGWVWGVVGFIVAIALCAGAYFLFNQTAASDETGVERQTDVYEDEEEWPEELPQSEMIEIQSEEQPVEVRTKNNQEQVTPQEEQEPAVTAPQEPRLKSKEVISQVKEKPAPASEEPAGPEAPKETEPVKPTPVDPATDPNLQPVQ